VADGFVSPGFREGSLFIRNAGGEVTRLAWEPLEGGEATKPADGKTARWRALPPGTYTLTGFRFLRKDDTGRDWFVSAISPQGIRKFVVKPGRVQKIDVDPSVTIGVRGSAKDGFMIQVPIHGMHRAGVSIYREGRRIPLTFTITGADGERIEEGRINYG
jgi:hypothetical protein